MNTNLCLNNSRGFSLVELLVVMAIMGIVVIGIYEAQQSMQRSTFAQEEVVDLQQRLRVAIDIISDDIHYAGFLLPSTQTPILVAGVDTITIQTAAYVSGSAKVATSFTSPSDNAAPITMNLEDESIFVPTNYFRIVRPGNDEVIGGAIITVTGNGTPDATEKAAGIKAKLVVEGFTVAQTIQRGDMLVRYVDPNTDGDFKPNTPPAENLQPFQITYVLDGTDLKRNTGVVAEGISSLSFSYISDAGGIRAVRVDISGQGQTTEGVKTRSISNTIMLRNG